MKKKNCKAERIGKILVEKKPLTRKIDSSRFLANISKILYKIFKSFQKPKELNNIYKDIALSQEVLSKIYNPPNGYGKHGISPDYAIKNIRNGKTLYIEVKRQDGWVEGKDMSAGRGNAHERACKLFTPGLLEIMREKQSYK